MRRVKNLMAGLPVLAESKANKANLPSVLIYEGEWVNGGVDSLGLPTGSMVGGMEDYSGWSYAEHWAWVRELTGLPIPFGAILATDESCSVVWVLKSNRYNSKCWLIHKE